MRNAEKKSFITIFSISFVVLIALSFSIFYLYYEEGRDHIKQEILIRMKEYTFNFKDNNFVLDIIKRDKNTIFGNINEINNGLITYFKYPKNDKYTLKVIYSKEKFAHDISILLYKVFKIASLSFLFIILFSIVFAFYAIRPMRNALGLLEVFLKDLIHDLNTPVSSILLNVKLLEKRGRNDELDRIKLSATTISSLYKNLEVLKNQKLPINDKVNVLALVNERVDILEKLYPKISFEQNLISLHVTSNKEALSRIIDNILTNACKYNKKNGKIVISIVDNILIVEDTGVGIKNLDKVFERYYKENERGLGLGMNIVKKLCDELKIDIQIKSKINIGTTVKLTLN